MGRWLSALRAREISESPQRGTDKTDKTSSDGVLSVLSVPVLSISQKFLPDGAGVKSETVSHLVPDYEERAAFLEYDGRLPRPWAEAMARLECQEWPASEDARWRQAIDDAGLFLDQWREHAERLGWQPGDVLDAQTGIIWHVQGGTIDAITRDHVIVCARDGRQRRFTKGGNRPAELH